MAAAGVEPAGFCGGPFFTGGSLSSLNESQLPSLSFAAGAGFFAGGGRFAAAPAAPAAGDAARGGGALPDIASRTKPSSNFF